GITSPSVVAGIVGFDLLEEAARGVGVSLPAKHENVPIDERACRSPTWRWDGGAFFVPVDLWVISERLWCDAGNAAISAGYDVDHAVNGCGDAVLAQLGHEREIFPGVGYGV